MRFLWAGRSRGERRETRTEPCRSLPVLRPGGKDLGERGRVRVSLRVKTSRRRFLPAPGRGQEDSREPRDGDAGFAFGVGELTGQGRARGTHSRPSTGTGAAVLGLGSLLSLRVFAPQHPQWEQPQRRGAHLWDDHVSGQVSARLLGRASPAGGSIIMTPQAARPRET